MKQQSFSDIEYANRKKKTKREEFLDSMDQIIPWQRWVDPIKAYYPQASADGHQEESKQCSACI